MGVVITTACLPWGGEASVFPSHISWFACCWCASEYS